MPRVRCGPGLGVEARSMRTRMNNPEFQYEIACARLCGLGHARMKGFVTVQIADEFQKWLDERVKEVAAEEDNPSRKQSQRCQVKREMSSY
jgi:cytochrome c oxidase subunit 2